jgi:hypothetical protein
MGGKIAKPILAGLVPNRQRTTQPLVIQITVERKFHKHMTETVTRSPDREN